MVSTCVVFSVVYNTALVMCYGSCSFLAEIEDMGCSLVFVPTGGPVIKFLLSKATQ